MKIGKELTQWKLVIYLMIIINLYRFSEILCISRNEFKGIMAVEASHYGDYEVAILQGKVTKKN